MSQNNHNSYSVRLSDFIDEVMMPSESLARICLQSSLDLDSSAHPKAELNDIGTVCAALTAHAKLRLRDAMGKLVEKTGDVKVWQESCEDMHTGATDVTVQGQADPACRQ